VTSCGFFKEYVAQPVGKVFDWDTEVEVKFFVKADINPDDNNRPSPLVVRIYELAATETFTQANFRDLFLNDKEVLGGDFIKVHKLKPLVPGVDRNDYFKLKEGTAFVGLFAEFNQYKDADFRIVIPVDEYLTTRQDVRLTYKSMVLLR
jgi:type VI secretion system protein VasD